MCVPFGDEKGVYNSYTLGGNQNLVTVNESGLYALKYKASVKMVGCPVLNTGHWFVVFSCRFNVQPTMSSLSIA